jgi:hypothetical protein
VGRPLSKKLFGDPNSATRTYPAVTLSAAWLPGQGSAATNPVYILKQTGVSRYLVTDGTNTGVVSLVGHEPAAAGQAAMYVTPYVAGAESGATFQATYKVLTAAPHAGAAGSGYVTGDTLNMGNGVTLTVTASGGAITSLAVSAAGSKGTVNTAARTAVAPVSTSGSGTGATVDMTWGLNGITATGGTGYTQGEQLTFVGIAATTAPTASIASVNGSGAPQTFTITAGTNITTSATSIVTANSQIKTYARVLKNKTVKTWDGKIYSWDPYNAASVAGQANVPRNTGTGTEASTYNSGSEYMSISGSAPYIQPNQGVTAKASQILATAGVPGGAGSQSQATPNTGTSDGGVYNPSTTQRKAPPRRVAEATKRKEKMAKAKAALKAKSAEFQARQSKTDSVKPVAPTQEPGKVDPNAGPPPELVQPDPEPAAPHLDPADMEHATHRS